MGIKEYIQISIYTTVYNNLKQIILQAAYLLVDRTTAGSLVPSHQHPGAAPGVEHLLGAAPHAVADPPLPHQAGRAVLSGASIRPGLASNSILSLFFIPLDSAPAHW